MEDTQEVHNTEEGSGSDTVQSNTSWYWQTRSSKNKIAAEERGACLCELDPTTVVSEIAKTICIQKLRRFDDTKKHFVTNTFTGT